MADPPDPVPLPGQLNFKLMDQEVFKQEIRAANWQSVLGAEDDKMSANFTEAICKAAMKANAPRHRGARVRRCQAQLDHLTNQRLKYTRQNMHPSATKKDKLENDAKIERINSQIERLISEDRLAEEERVIKAFQTSSISFYKYANRFKKSKGHVGPLKTGATFADGPREMAEILSRKYQGVFSQPVTDPASANFEPQNSASILTDIEITEPQLVSAMKT